jgi:pimeloyl-ACP methyl ester carboxylesterase
MADNVSSIALFLNAFSFAIADCQWAFQSCRPSQAGKVGGGELSMNVGNTTVDVATKPKWRLALFGLMIIVSGAFLAHMIRVWDGISVRDIRFAGADGTVMSALLYVPQGASATARVPGILAVHGYINSRETQDGFAIEFARRGYVVLALDQTGHGYSGGAAFSNGFGGPDGLRYLRSLPMVDTSQIGLEGHSMGGWTILAAAAAMPDGYRSMVLEGSSTGAPFAKEGSTTWPRNLALVFSRYDEFSKIMWGVDRALDVPTSPKLQAVFGTSSPIVEGQLYGSVVQGTARLLQQPSTTHPGDHFSTTAIGDATDWFAKTLSGGQPKPAGDQMWFWKEFGTGIGLIGFVILLLGVFDGLIRTPYFATLQAETVPAAQRRDRRWWRSFALNSFMPAFLFFPVFIAVTLLIPASPWLPQVVSTQVTLWALVGAGVTLLVDRWTGTQIADSRTAWPKSLLLAVLTVATVYAVLWFVDFAFHTDVRFWIVAVKLPSARQGAIAALYVIPLTLAFLVTLRTLCGALTVQGDRALVQYGAAAFTLTTGLVVMLGTIYGIFFATGSLITAFDPLSTVIALQFVPVLTAVAVVGIYTWRRTNSHRPGALMVGILVTLYVVAGTATQV